VTSPIELIAIARAFDMDPQDIRADTPVDVIGWTGSATDWLLAADHLGVMMMSEPPESIEVATIADVVAIVTSSAQSRPNDES
jgi:hypothetical protein